MGCYQEGIAKDSVGGKDVTAHIFEFVFLNNFLCYHLILKHHSSSRYTTNVLVTDTGEVSTSACPVQILFCLKEQNKKKLNSHRWFFNAFGPLLKPNGTYALYAPAYDGVDKTFLI
jgi:chitin synthase